MTRILVADPIANEGVELLKQHAQVDVRTGLKPDDIKGIIGEYDALVVRSETKVTADILRAAQRLQVVGRAGVGVDNIDLNAATEKGVAVVNAPTGNIIAAAEHTMALLLALARRVPQAHQSLKAGQWQRKQFMGVALKDKTLGLIGLGRVGSQVAHRAQGFQMRILGYDPFITAEVAKSMGVELCPMDRLLKESDFVSLHIPLTDTTKALIGKRELELLKPSAYIINTSRGGLIDEPALIKALDEGRLAGVALDVFTKEPPENDPLVPHPKIIVTPHLGASTNEAQQEVAVEVAEQVLAVINGQPARYTVNVPFLAPEAHAAVSPFLATAALLGKLAGQLADGQYVSLAISYEGDMAKYDASILRSAVLTGLLAPTSEERVNLVNASTIAQRKGLRVVESKGDKPEHYANLITATLTTSAGDTIISGTLMRGESHIVRISDYWLDMVPSAPYLLFIDHQDRPGMIGAVGTITGKNDVNISFMEVGRLAPRGHAMMVLGLDDPMPEAVLQQIRSVQGVRSARVVRP